MLDIALLVKAVDEALSRILGVLTPEPTSESLMDNLDALSALEKVWNRKALIDAAVAYAAQKAEAGRLVGSTQHIDFLMKHFDISYPEAIRRVQLAQQLFGNPAPPPSPENSEHAVGESEQNTDQEQPKPSDRSKKRLVDAAKKAELSAEKLAIINQEVDQLNSCARSGRDELFDQAIRQARLRGTSDLRMWVRRVVVAANARTPDPFAAARRRYLAISAPDPDGSVRIQGRLTSATAALLKAALAPLTKRGSLVDVAPEEDTRSHSQRNADGLHHIVSLFHSGQLAKGRSGIGSIVVSLTADDVDNFDGTAAGYRYPTNTGYKLTAFEILNLGAARFDFGVVLDSETGRPLYLGRTQRAASLEQRIALQAAELVCSAPGCSRAMIDCEIHHLDPWIRGGLTDIDNLTPQCFVDHPKNDDSRTGVNGKGFMVRDPVSGRVGRWRPDDVKPEFNDTTAQEESGGARARAKHGCCIAPNGQSPPDDS